MSGFSSLSLSIPLSLPPSLFSLPPSCLLIPFLPCSLSPRYLPDFVLHGTSESADQAFQDKLLKDLAHTVKVGIYTSTSVFLVPWSSSAQ